MMNANNRKGYFSLRRLLFIIKIPQKRQKLPSVDNVSELKCCKLCGSFYTCEHKGECCPECTYFDQDDNICLAPDALKKGKKPRQVMEKVEEVDPETFLFDDIEDEDEEDLLSDDDDDDDDNLDFDDFIDDDW